MDKSAKQRQPQQHWQKQQRKNQHFPREDFLSFAAKIKERKEEIDRKETNQSKSSKKN